MNAFNVLMIWIICCLCILTETKGQTTTSITATPTANTFNSHSGYGTSNYAANYTHEWIIHTFHENHTLTVSFTACELEYVTKTSNCLFDLVKIYDGTTSNDTKLLETCCPGTIPGSVSSSGPDLFITFETDPTIEFGGFVIQYVSDGVTTTTSTTTTPTTTTVTTTTTTAAPTPPSETNIIPYIAAAVGLICLILIIVIIVIACKKMKNKNNNNNQKEHTIKAFQRKQDVKTVFFHYPPQTKVIPANETNIFDFDLPNGGRGNKLPPMTPPLNKLPPLTLDVFDI